MSRLSYIWKSKKYRKKRNHFLILLSSVLIAAILLTILLHSCTAKQETWTASAPTNEMLINDKYEGKKLIPKYDIKKNIYQDSKFSTKSGIKSYADKNAFKGVDVSAWQGDINWKKVKKAGIDFAMIRVGYRGQVQGSICEDTKYEQNMKGALSAGLKVGVYFYSQAVTKSETEEEAAYVLKKIAPYKVTWPIAFDWEAKSDNETASSGSLRTQTVTPEDASAFAKVFCEDIKAAGYQPCFYTNKNMGYTAFDLKLLEKYPMWYAEYKNLPSFYYHFDLWQYTSKGKIDGINNLVDLNISFRKFG